MRGVAFAALLLLGGCARNAVFELELELPARPAGGPGFAFVQIRDDAGFDADWSAIGGPPAIPLADLCGRPTPAPACQDRALDPSCSAVVSVVGGDSDLARPLRIRIRFCGDPACAAPADAAAPEVDVEVERAFYTGAYTQGRVCVDELPTGPPGPPERIERCDVRCRQGDAVSQCRADGTHFCEDPG